MDATNIMLSMLLMVTILLYIYIERKFQQIEKLLLRINK